MAAASKSFVKNPEKININIEGTIQIVKTPLETLDRLDFL